MSIVPLPIANDVVNRFIDLLLKHDIAPPAKSGIEDELLSVTDLLKLPTNLSRNLRPGLLAQGGGIFDLAAKLLAVELEPEFSSFLPHLKLFGSTSLIASVTQSAPAAETDDVHRKLAELYLGSLAIHIGGNVKLDDPDNSRGDNPDVMFDFTQDNGVKRRWALAIKTTSTKSGQTLFENISKASRQINAPDCNADHGIVVINLQEPSLDHHSLWARTFANLTEAMAAVHGQIVALAREADRDRPAGEWREVLSGKTSPVVLYMGHSVVKLRAGDGSSVPTILKILVRDYPLGRSDGVSEAIAWGLNHYMQSILRGNPGAQGQQPS